MTTLSKLKLVAEVKPSAVAPIVIKRHKLIRRLGEQIALATALADGREYVGTRMRIVYDEETQTKKAVEQAKLVKAWWWTTTSGKVCVAIKYGARTIELGKGKTAVELDGTGELVATLTMLKDAVAAGELDAAIEVASNTIRTKFSK